MRFNRRILTLAALACAPLAILPSAWAQKPLVMGFSQVGAESEWRTANTESIKSAAKEAGIELKFSDAQQKQENQIKAIRSFIAQRVDVIAFSPVVESGWEPVLREAKAAKIPVILTDRAVNVKDKSLYVTFIGSDFVEEGRKAPSVPRPRSTARRASRKSSRPIRSSRSSARRPVTSRAPRARR
jgi:ABC-type sugar transport system substrate-binding protein